MINGRDSAAAPSAKVGFVENGSGSSGSGSKRPSRKQNRPKAREVEEPTAAEIAEDNRRRFKMRSGLLYAYEDLGRVRLEIMHLEAYGRIRNEYYDFVMSTLDSEEELQDFLQRKRREAEELALLIDALKARGDALANATAAKTEDIGVGEDAGTQTPARSVSPSRQVAAPVEVTEEVEMVPVKTEYVQVIRRRIASEVALIQSQGDLTPMMLWWQRWGNLILLFVTGFLLGRLTGDRSLALRKLLPRVIGAQF